MSPSEKKKQKQVIKIRALLITVIAVLFDDFVIRYIGAGRGSILRRRRLVRLIGRLGRLYSIQVFTAIVQFDRIRVQSLTIQFVYFGHAEDNVLGILQHVPLRDRLYLKTIINSVSGTIF